VKRPRAPQAYWLFGLIAARTQRDLPTLSQARAERYEDLAAVVAEHPDGREPPGPDAERHRAVVADVFAQCAVLPAPPGTVFRSMGVLRRWLELHHTALLGGLAYIDGRAEGRVHVRRVGGAVPASTRAAAATRALGAAERGAAGGGAPRDGAGLEATAAQIFHALGKDQAARVVSSLAPLGRDAGEVSASFLVDRSRWRAFADAVAGEQHRDLDLEVRLTGPWPPYDFVRLQFGG
jgi:Gas vesicle synthesis protein GvpL/GvpF